MSIPMRYAPRRAHVPYWWLLATAAAAVIAVGPILAALVSSFGGATGTAFASAPDGNYALVARVESTADVLVAVSAVDGTPREIARVGHLAGYGSYGAVSPDGARVALVVADGGVQSRPIASLVVVELESGTMRKIASGVDYLQPPVWTRDGAGVVVSRSAATGPLASVSLARAMTDGSGEAELATARGVLGAYPVGFDSAGRFLHVVIDSRGSTLYRDGGELALLSDGITRDWRLDGDATALAYIETRTDGGLKYVGRAIELDGAVAAQGAPDAGAGESLGVAWRAGDARPVFGREPGGAGAVAAQGTASIGFDVPLLYSADGQALAVQRWTGRSFDEPGEGSLELVQSGGGRISLDGYARFFGWAVK